MARHLTTPFVILCVLICAACGADTSIDPFPTTPVVPQETLTTFVLRPDSAEFNEGEELQLSLTILDRRSFQPVVLPAIAFSSSSPLIAHVSPTGLVTGTGPGTAVISARAVVGDSTFITSARIVVRPPPTRDSLVLEAKSDGWAPTPGHVVAGGKVEWKPGVIDAAGVPVTAIYILGSNNSVIDSIDLSRGPAVRRFNSPGKITYCSNACWDLPEYGVIIVH